MCHASRPSRSLLSPCRQRAQRQCSGIAGSSPSQPVKATLVTTTTTMAVTARNRLSATAAPQTVRWTDRGSAAIPFRTLMQKRRSRRFPTASTRMDGHWTAGPPARTDGQADLASLDGSPSVLGTGTCAGHGTLAARTMQLLSASHTVLRTPWTGAAVGWVSLARSLAAGYWVLQRSTVIRMGETRIPRTRRAIVIVDDGQDGGAKRVFLMMNYEAYGWLRLGLGGNIFFPGYLLLIVCATAEFACVCL